MAPLTRFPQSDGSAVKPVANGDDIRLSLIDAHGRESAGAAGGGEEESLDLFFLRRGASQVHNRYNRSNPNGRTPWMGRGLGEAVTGNGSVRIVRPDGGGRSDGHGTFDLGLLVSGGQRR